MSETVKQMLILDHVLTCKQCFVVVLLCVLLICGQCNQCFVVCMYICGCKMHEAQLFDNKNNIIVNYCSKIVVFIKTKAKL